MPEQNIGDVLKRVSELEGRVKDVEHAIQDMTIKDIQLENSVKSLSKEVKSVKTDVLVTLQDHNDKTWKLLNNLGKLIVILLFVILMLVGVKITPDILKFL